MSFGERLKQARLEKNLLQSELAELLGVSKSAIANYETEVSSPKEEILLKIFDVLNVTPNFLFQDSFTVDKENEFYTLREKNVINMYRKLNDSGKEKTEDYINDLVSNPNYCANDNVIQITEQPRKEFDFSTVKIAGDDGEFKVMHYTPEEQEEIRKAIEKDPELKKYFGI